MRSLYALGRKSPQTVADDVAAMWAVGRYIFHSAAELTLGGSRTHALCRLLQIVGMPFN
jgi:hypothetical protein